jgi:hypothetical protein
VHATQQMGVNMSNAVKREGVVIIQNQNIEVYARIPQHLLIKDGLTFKIQIVKFYFNFIFNDVLWVVHAHTYRRCS